MSLILEALQRADRERNRNHSVPGIDTEHPGAEEDKPVVPGRNRSRSLAPVPVLLTLCVLLLLTVVYLQLRPREPASSAPKPVPTRETAVAPTGQAPLSQGDSRSRETGAQNNGPVINKAPRKAVTPNVRALYERALEESQLAQESTDSATDSAASETGRSTAPGEATKERTTAPAAENTEQSGEDLYSVIPYIGQLPDAVRSAIPPIRYTSHGYSAETGTGLVMLNGRSRRVGDVVGAGLKLLAIQPDYIVLEHQGRLFRLQAATDWDGY